MPRFLLAALLLTALLTAGHAQQDKKEEKKPAPKPSVFLTVEEAGPDYQIQGEYQGTSANNDKLGAQVVALGEGKFDVYLLSGGLPGAGWDKKGRVKVPAKTDGGKTQLQGKDYSGTLADGKLSGQGPQGSFSLARVDRKSPTAGLKAPAGAIILFDGSNVDHWGNGKIVEKDLLFCGTNSKTPVGAGKFHIEFRTPFQPKAGGQGRGNSGVYVLGREIQVLDSFGLNGEKNECGAFYGSARPDVNMCLPPLVWQTYDVDIFEKDGKVLATVVHNGVTIHEDFELGTGKATPKSVNLQNHGNPVVYRNIWHVPAK